MSTNSIVIKAGQTVVLPRDVKVTGLFISGGLTVSSTCNNLPAPTPTACFVFSWETSATPAFGDAYFSHIILNDSFSYVIPDTNGGNQYQDAGNNEALKVAGVISTIPNFAGTIIAYDQASVSSLRQIKIRLPYFGVLPKFRIVQPLTGYSQILYLESVETDCLVPGGWSAW